MTPLRALARGLVGEPFEPPVEWIRRWPELGAARYRRGGLPPRLGGWALGVRAVAGIALFDTVWLARGVTAGPELLLHEVRHVQQFREHRGFALRYVWETLRRGYAANAYEVDARAYAARRSSDGTDRA
jgi:hypothetical protein